MSEFIAPSSENIKLQSRLAVYNQIPGVTARVSFIRSDHSGGSQLRNCMSELAQILGDTWKTEHQQNPQDDLIIGIPRGGVPMSDGLSLLFPGLSYAKVDIHNSGEGNELSNMTVQNQNTPHILLADGVIVTGQTIQRMFHRLALPESAKVTAFAAVALREGVNNLLLNFPNLQLVVGCVDELPKNEWDGYRYKMMKTISGMRDVGARVSM